MSDQNQNQSSLYENSEYPSRRRPTRQSQSQRQRRPQRGHGRGGTGRKVLKVLGTLFLVGLCTGAILCCFAAVYIQTVIIPIADMSLDDYPIGENSIMYYQDADGQYQELTTLLNTTSSIWVDFEEIPEDLINAAVAIEDKRFWTHSGVDWLRTGRAVLSMFTGGDIQGGSTITQQLIKNITGYNETTVKRKITEIVRALRFTQNYSKEDTITYYLNISPLGAGCDGVGSASLAYFGKPVSELTLAECASLIAITNNPSRYGPYSDARVATSTGEMWTARQWNKWRQELVLSNMLEQGMISQEEHDEAVAQELVFQRAEGEDAPQEIYSWYEETVIADVSRDLEEQLGWSESRIDQMLSRGGLRIYTCVDPELQAIAEEIYSDRANLDYTSRDGQQMQSSITIIDNSTGDVVAIVGQFGEKEGNLLSNYANDTRYARQPGSSFKPLAVYAPALELSNVSPITVTDDYPYQLLGGSPWPVNSGAARYQGRTTIRSAVTHSVNTVAVRVLADLVTPAASFQFVEERFKIDLEDGVEVNGQIRSDMDISPLALGGLTNGVTTRQMAQAYSVFPNGGVYTPSRTYTRVTQLVDGEEVVILENESSQEAVLSGETAYYITSMLENVVSSGTGGRANLSGMHEAGKTGTTSDNYDRWFVGYTPYYTAAVWTGYPYNATISGSTNPAVVLWQQVMSQVHEGLEDQSFSAPSGLTSVQYCLDSGLAANEYCAMDPRGSRVSSDRVFADDVPSGQCTIHTAESVVTVCVDCPILDADGNATGLYHIAGPYCPEASLQQVCLPDYEREAVGDATAQDNIYRKSVVEGYGLCTVHTEPTVVEPDPTDPDTPVDPDQPTDPEQPTDPGETGGESGSGETGGDESNPPSQDIRPVG